MLSSTYFSLFRSPRTLFSIRTKNSIKYASTLTTNNLMNVKVNDKTGIAVVEMNSLPVNSQNLEFFKALSKTIDDLEENKSKGLILTSASKTVFSAGLDINELYKPDAKRFKEFWYTFQEVWLKLYGTGIPTAAAINGHAPAGGCVLALCCEYRSMLPTFKIGLNETAVGIAPPKWVSLTMLNVVPVRLAEQSLILGTLHNTEEALKIGLIDDISNDKIAAINKCEQFLLQFSKISHVARTITKQALRSKVLQYLEDDRTKDIEYMWNHFTKPETINFMGKYLNNLKNKNKK